MGYAATIAISNSDGDTIRPARRRSGIPRERRRCGEPALIEAASIGLWLLEGRQGLVHVLLRLRERSLRIRRPRQSVVHVLVDGLRDLAVDRRDGPALRLLDRLLELVDERQRLLDRRVRIGRRE